MPEQKNNELVILCPFCNKEYTAEMSEELSSGYGCDTCGYGSEPRGRVEVICSHCKKVVYVKEIN